MSTEHCLLSDHLTFVTKDDQFNDDTDSDDENWIELWDKQPSNLITNEIENSNPNGNDNVYEPYFGTGSNCKSSMLETLQLKRDNHDNLIQEEQVNIASSEVSSATSLTLSKLDSHSRLSNTNRNRIDNDLVPVKRIELNDHKAGMEGLDKERINQIIYEASKDSSFYTNEQIKERKMTERIARLKHQLKGFSEENRMKAEALADKFLKELDHSRAFDRTIVHIDMDAFYAAVEMRDNPSLKEKPMAVGSLSMLSTSNYIARKYGVRAAMPGFIGKKLCPDLIIVPSNFDKYKAVSVQMKNILNDYDSNFAAMSLDEAYLDLTWYLENHKHEYIPKDMNACFNKDCITEEDDNCKVINQHKFIAEKIVEEIRQKIFKETHLTASAGIAANTMLAKICSDMNKPNGQYYLAPNKKTVLNFVHTLPVRKIPGIGKVSEQVLNAFGVQKCVDLYKERGTLFLLFSEVTFQHFMRVSLGVSANFIGTESEQKSISTETTFQELSKPDELLAMCNNLCESLANDLQSKELAGRTVTLKLKLTTFQVRTRSKTIHRPICSAKEIYQVAKEILKNEIKSASPLLLKLRLMGVRMSELVAFVKSAQNTTIDSLFANKSSLVAQEKTNYGQCNLIHTYSNQGICQAPNSDINEGKIYSDYAKCDVVCGQLVEVEGRANKQHLSEGDITIICPICNLVQSNNIDINSHIDQCLSKQTIKEIISTDSINRTEVIHKGEFYTEGKKRKSNVQDYSRDEESKRQTLLKFWAKRT